MSIALHQQRRNPRGIKPVKNGTVPRLRNGDHLTIPEFERRFEATPELKFAELIEGIAVLSPRISNLHSGAHGLVYALLKNYAWATPSTAATLCASLRLDGQNEYQPDAMLRIKAGSLVGRTVAPDGLLDGSPEFLAEIAVSRASYDLHEKKEVYQRCHVQEYLVWQVMDAQIHWFALEDGQYLQLKSQADGVVRSRVFPGLWLDLRGMLAGDEQKVLRTLDKGIKSASHRAFVKELKS